MRGTVPEAKWALLISNNDNSLFANCGPSSHSALMTPPVNMGTPASLSWLSLRHPPPAPRRCARWCGTPSISSAFPHILWGPPSCVWPPLLVVLLPTCPSIPPAPHASGSLGKGLEEETGVLPFWPFGGAVWCRPRKAACRQPGTQEHEHCRDRREAPRSNGGRRWPLGSFIPLTLISFSVQWG